MARTSHLVPLQVAGSRPAVVCAPRMVPGMIGADGSTTGGSPHDLSGALAELPSPRIVDPLLPHRAGRTRGAGPGRRAPFAGRTLEGSAEGGCYDARPRCRFH